MFPFVALPVELADMLPIQPRAISLGERESRREDRDESTGKGGRRSSGRKERKS